MTKMLLAHNYFTQALDNSWDKSWACAHEPVFNRTIIDEGGFYNRLLKFTTDYKSWLNDMASNKRQFAPFNLATGEKDVFAIISGLKPKSIKFLSVVMDSNYDLFNLFSLVTDTLIEEKLKI